MVIVRFLKKILSISQSPKLAGGVDIIKSQKKSFKQKQENDYMLQQSSNAVKEEPLKRFFIDKSFHKQIDIPFEYREMSGIEKEIWNKMRHVKGGFIYILYKLAR